MSPKSKIIIALLSVAMCTTAVSSDTPANPEDAFTKSVERAISVFITQRRADLVKPKSIRFFLIAPSPYSDAEFKEAKRVGTGEEPFWIGGHPHQVFREVALSAVDATRFGQCLYDDLNYPESHEEFKLLSLCLFQPMHAFEVIFDDGKKIEGAICVHCGDMMLKLPRSGMEEYRGVQTKELIAETNRILPIPKKLEKRFFSK